MKTDKKNKSFDAVKMMRDIRDKIGVETQNMTLDELKIYIKNQVSKSNLKPLGL